MTLTQITPFVPCTSLAAQIGFFCDTLGFTAGFQSEFYAFVHRDGVAVRLVQVSDEVDLKHPERQGSFYIDVDGIDAVYAAMKPALDKLPEGRVRAPFNQPYDQREFHVFDEDCTLIFFGEAIASNTK
jgi:catechol 2,3-dioxygenase-like lactoylglutathione lyase family enzyme